jgi:ribonuclease J
MGQIFELASRLGKRVAVTGRSMKQNIVHARELGYLEHALKTLVSLDDMGSIDRRKLIVISSGSQAEFGSALMRIAAGEHRHVKLQENDLVVMSSRYIPGNERAIGRMINELFKCGAEVLYEAVHEIHASGHATRPELKKMIEWTKPKYFIPVHGEYRHLVHHAKLARECGMLDSSVMVAANGDVIEIEPDRFEKIDHIEEPRVLVEGREGNDISKLILKDRRQLGETGVVFALMVRNRETMRVMAGPQLITKGLAHESMEGWLVEEGTKVALQVVAQYEREIAQGHYTFDLQETVRIELRRFFNQNIGKKPVVLPIILDL